MRLSVFINHWCAWERNLQFTRWFITSSFNYTLFSTTNQTLLLDFLWYTSVMVLFTFISPSVIVVLYGAESCLRKMAIVQVIKFLKLCYFLRCSCVIKLRRYWKTIQWKIYAMGFCPLVSFTSIVTACCYGASVRSEQQHNQDLRSIYRRRYEFSSSSLFTRMHCI